MMGAFAKNKVTLSTFIGHDDSSAVQCILLLHLMKTFILRLKLRLTKMLLFVCIKLANRERKGYNTNYDKFDKWCF
jgi:hypothetical protein